MKTKEMKVTALVDRFGSNRINASLPGELLRGCTCIAIPFAGGMCEVPHMTANIINVNDLDRHVINLAAVVRDKRASLAEKLDATPFHPDELNNAQAFCDAAERLSPRDHRAEMFGSPTIDPFEWAFRYFICSWMGRGGKGGTDGEFDGGMSIRWKSGGGDSVVRFRNATASLAEWQKVMRRCTFTTFDAFDFIGECKKRDIAENGIYCDPPWPADGDAYKHKFDEAAQRRLAKDLAEFENTKIVVRYGEHPLIRELYQEPWWTFRPVTSRTQANNDKAELLITNF